MRIAYFLLISNIGIFAKQHYKYIIVRPHALLYIDIARFLQLALGKAL